MKEKLESIKFNLTPIMSKELIKFNALKKELLNLKSKEILTKENIIKIKELENKLEVVKINFINEFRKNNIEEIDMYLKMKDQF